MRCLAAIDIKFDTVQKMDHILAVVSFTVSLHRFGQFLSTYRCPFTESLKHFHRKLTAQYTAKVRQKYRDFMWSRPRIFIAKNLRPAYLSYVKYAGRRFVANPAYFSVLNMRGAYVW